MTERESELELRARLRADLDALAFDDWLVCARAECERAFGPPPDYVGLPAGYTVLDEGPHRRDVMILREARLYGRLAEDIIDIAKGAKSREARAWVLEQVTLLCADMLGTAICSLSPPESRVELGQSLCRQPGEALGARVETSLQTGKSSALKAAWWWGEDTKQEDAQ